MVEEANSDMSPQQEESVKAPLTGDSVAIQVKEDASAQQADEGGFQGLTKEELMEYASAPFWVRLRIFLMALFWISWAAMLAIAILVIVRAPSCPPPPSSTWLEQGAMLQLDVDADAGVIRDEMTQMDVKTLYVPELISSEDYRQLNPRYDQDSLVTLFQNLTEASIKIVTDFVPSPLSRSHAWTRNESYGTFYDHQTMALQYNATDIDTQLEEDFMFWAKEFNVTGFLVREADSSNEKLQNLTITLNQRMNPEVAFGSRVIDLKPVLGDLADLSAFVKFVKADRANDTFYKVHPVQEKVEEMQAVLLSLMTLSGTPIMRVPQADLDAFGANYTDVVANCTQLRREDAFKWGDVLFANTSSSVLAYTRSLKGTPGYAVAVNTDATDAAVVDFSAVAHVPETGLVKWELRPQGREGPKVEMKAVKVAPLNGVVIQVVSDYSQ